MLDNLKPWTLQRLLKSVLEMNHMQMQDLIDFTDPDEGGENPAPMPLMKVGLNVLYVLEYF